MAQATTTVAPRPQRRSFGELLSGDFRALPDRHRSCCAVDLLRLAERRVPHGAQPLEPAGAEHRRRHHGARPDVRPAGEGDRPLDRRHQRRHLGADGEAHRRVRLLAMDRRAGRHPDRRGHRQPVGALGHLCRGPLLRGDPRPRPRAQRPAADPVARDRALRPAGNRHRADRADEHLGSLGLGGARARHRGLRSSGAFGGRPPQEGGAGDPLPAVRRRCRSLRPLPSASSSWRS